MTKPVISLIPRQFDHQAEHFMLSIGDWVSFGNYPYEQDGNWQPIEWRVLDQKGTTILLLSEYGLDAMPYHKEWSNVTWEHSNIRKWLNGEFLDMAFTDEERQKILITDIDNSKAQGYSGYTTNGGNGTKDQVFLLIDKETFEDYFPCNEERMCKPTNYAIERGAWQSRTTSTGCWWLRSPGYYQYNATYVDSDGSRDINNVHNDYVCVRPALWVNLNSEIFHQEKKEKEMVKPVTVFTVSQFGEGELKDTLSFSTYENAYLDMQNEYLNQLDNFKEIGLYITDCYIIGNEAMIQTEETIRYTATFENGYQMDIKCCGVKYEPPIPGEDVPFLHNAAWAEAVLYNPSKEEVEHSEVEHTFFDTWTLIDEESEYVVEVKKTTVEIKKRTNPVLDKKETSANQTKEKYIDLYTAFKLTKIGNDEMVRFRKPGCTSRIDYRYMTGKEVREQYDMRRTKVIEILPHISVTNGTFDGFLFTISEAGKGENR